MEQETAIASLQVRQTYSTRTRDCQSKSTNPEAIPNNDKSLPERVFKSESHTQQGQKTTMSKSTGPKATSNNDKRLPRVSLQVPTPQYRRAGTCHERAYKLQSHREYPKGQESAKSKTASPEATPIMTRVCQKQFCMSSSPQVPTLRLTLHTTRRPGKSAKGQGMIIGRPVSRSRKKTTPKHQRVSVASALSKDFIISRRRP